MPNEQSNDRTGDQATQNIGSLAPALEFLSSHQGSYQGDGTNVQGHPFKARLELKPRVSGSLVELVFLATDDESAFHEELTWVTPDLRTDRLCLWTVSTNTPGVLCHTLHEDRTDDFRTRRFVFRLGEPAQRHSFRQEITLDFMRDDSIEYRYSWGVPHEEFAVRVHARLHRQS